MAVPSGRYERIYEAAVRGRGKLLPAVASQLAELFEPETLFALCVLVGLWAAAQLTPAGPFADVALLVFSGYGVIKQLVAAGQDLYAWVSLASDAQSDDDLEAAAGHFAKAIATVGVEVLLAVISLKAFKMLKQKIRREPARFREGRGPVEEGRGPLYDDPTARFRMTPEPEPSRVGPLREGYAYAAATATALPGAHSYRQEIAAATALPAAPYVLGGLALAAVIVGVGVAATRSKRRG